MYWRVSDLAESLGLFLALRDGAFGRPGIRSREKETSLWRRGWRGRMEAQRQAGSLLTPIGGAVGIEIGLSGALGRTSLQ